MFFANLAGAFLLGLLATRLTERWNWNLGAFACTGVLGSFTTFSNVALDLSSLGTRGAWLLALGYAAASLTFGVLAAIAGVGLGRRLARRSAR